MNGEKYEVIKNFPTEAEIREALKVMPTRSSTRLARARLDLDGALQGTAVRGASRQPGRLSGDSPNTRRTLP